MKKNTFILTLLALVATAPAFADHFEYPYQYSVNNGEVTIVAVSRSYSGDLTIPDTLGGYPVVIIREYAFTQCEDLTSVIIPQGVTTIGEAAFEWCPALTAVTIPDSVTHIGEAAFYDCYSLASITIPNGVKNIGDYTFLGCESLTSATLGNATTNIDDYAFAWCESLTAITIPDSVTSIGNAAFLGCESLASLTLGNGVVSIGDEAFCLCNSLTTLTIPASVDSIGVAAFAACNSLPAINVNPANPNYVSQNGVLFDKTFNTLIQCPSGLVGAYVIPGTVTEIGEEAFADCMLLTAITIPDSVKTIGDSAFCWCGSLVSLTLGNKVDYIGTYAFFSCISLETVVIPASVDSIGEMAFGGCDSLTAIDVHPDNPNYASQDGVLFNKDLTTLIQYPGGRVGAYVIPNSVSEIGNNAFQFCFNLTAVTIPQGVDTICEEAFAWCNALTSVVIPSSVTLIADRGFYGCDSLSSIYFAGNAPELGFYVFLEVPATMYALPGTVGWDSGGEYYPVRDWMPRIVSFVRNAQSGKFRLTAFWAASQRVAIQTSISLTDPQWQHLESLTIPASGTIDYEDPDSTTHSSRYYRLVIEPTFN